MANSRMAPPIARAKLPTPHPVTPLLPHSARPMNPPTSAPAIPSNMVTNKPPGSLPGIRSLAMAPAINPKMAQPIIAPITLFLLDLDSFQATENYGNAAPLLWRLYSLHRAPQGKCEADE